MSTEQLRAWAADAQAWILELTCTPNSSWAKFLGRTRELSWVRSRLGDNTQGPLKDVKVGHDLSTAARACEIIKIMADKLLLNEQYQKFNRALCQLARSEHDTITQLEGVRDVQQTQRLGTDLQQLWFWCKGVATDPPPSISAVLEAICRKVEVARPDGRQRSKLAWVGALLQGGASKGHRWANAPNVSVELGRERLQRKPFVGRA